MINKLLNKKNIDFKFLFLILAILSIIICSVTIQRTYAQYITSLPQTSHVKLGSWLLTINDQNIIENSNISESVVPHFYTKSGDQDLATQDKIVPTSTASLELVLDYSKVSTPFKYELTLSQTGTNMLDDFKIINITLDDTVYTPENTNTITFTLDPETATSQTIRFDIIWDDSETQTMNDILDTSFANSPDTDLVFLLNIKFTQIQKVETSN